MNKEEFDIELAEIAEAIRTKKNSSEEIPFLSMAEEIEGLEVGESGPDYILSDEFALNGAGTIGQSYDYPNPTSGTYTFPKPLATTSILYFKYQHLERDGAPNSSSTKMSNWEDFPASNKAVYFPSDTYNVWTWQKYSQMYVYLTYKLSTTSMTVTFTSATKDLSRSSYERSGPNYLKTNIRLLVDYPQPTNPFT